MANNRKYDRWLSDEQVETEIAALKQSPRVALARAEQKEKYRIKYRRRQYLYTLRALEKRGRELLTLDEVKSITGYKSRNSVVKHFPPVCDGRFNKTTVARIMAGGAPC